MQQLWQRQALWKGHREVISLFCANLGMKSICTGLICGSAQLQDESVGPETARIKFPTTSIRILGNILKIQVIFNLCFFLYLAKADVMAGTLAATLILRK